ncbi:phage tail termination protein [Streptomyces sp. NPDC001089]
MTLSDVQVFPDAELMARNFLAEYFGDDAHLCTVLPGDPQFAELIQDKAVIRAIRIGGSWRFRRSLDEPMVDIDVWANSLASARSFANRARAAVADMAGDQRDGGLCTYSSEISGPGRRPEENQSVYRIGFTVGLLVRPA